MEFQIVFIIMLTYLLFRSIILDVKHILAIKVFHLKFLLIKLILVRLFARISFVNIDGIKGGFDTYRPKRKNRKNFDFKPLSDKFFMQIILYSAAFASKLRTCLIISKLIIGENYS